MKFPVHLRRCCWPPESVTPRSPTSVKSPRGNSARSASSAQHCIALAYLSQYIRVPINMHSPTRNNRATTIQTYCASMKGRPNRIFSRMVALRVHACCGHSTVVQLLAIATVEVVPGEMAVQTASPRKPDSSVDLPHPICPTIAISSPCLAVNAMSCTHGGLRTPASVTSTATSTPCRSGCVTSGAAQSSAVDFVTQKARSVQQPG